MIRWMPVSVMAICCCSSCANTQDTVIHALRDIIKHTPGPAWRTAGGVKALSPITPRRSQGQETPINLLGFKDATANPDTHQPCF
ncbi:Deferrochelatase/peroxidase EfeB precursor [Pantoea agglomerans]|uniref:Deferrochelatase/peroxidase EfeB n=1 Tax=Enterobacter agglomerans TaxID=549 RepID=A0A379AFF2_ENTAG|nr:Deferrochelatase/peroxidase EfeB precursor [Pantoea agglomerans]